MSSEATLVAIAERKRRARLDPASTTAQTRAAARAAATEQANTKRKSTLALRQHQQGVKNSQHGTCWVYCQEIVQCKKIALTELSDYLQRGWTREFCLMIGILLRSSRS